MQQVAGEGADLARHRRGEEQVLAHLRQFGHKPPDGVDEAHVEHLVGLVEDENLDLVEAQIALVEMIDQPPGRRDDDVDAARQFLRLRTVGHAAEHDGAREAEPGAVAGEALGDLARELPRRREDQRAAGARLRPLAALRQPLEDRQREGTRLAGARLGDAEHVASGEHIGNRLRLDRRRGEMILGRKRLQQRCGEVEVREACHVISMAARTKSGRRRLLIYGEKPCVPASGEERRASGHGRGRWHPAVTRP